MTEQPTSRLQAKLPFISYVTDNPFRLLNIGSATLQPELRRRANSSSKMVAAGILPEVGLRNIFGDDELAACPDIVRRLSNDAKSRTAYRLFWPFEYEGITMTDEPRSPADGLFFGLLALQGFHQTQLSFLRAWGDFLLNQDPDSLQEALQFLADLYQDEQCDDYLCGLLSREGLGDPIEVVWDAQHEAISSVLRCGYQQAVQLWEAENTSRAMSVIELASKCPLPDEFIAEALRSVIRPLGGREKRKLDSSIENFSGPANTADLHGMFEDASRLQLLSCAVDGYLPDAAEWASTAEEGVEQICYGAIQQATKLVSEEGNYGEASDLLERIRQLEVPPAVRQKIDEELDFIEKCQGASHRSPDKPGVDNLDGRLFEADIPTGGVLVPPMCTCCMGPADGETRVSGTWTEEFVAYRRTHTVSFAFPTCGQCLSHSTELSNKVFALIALTVTPAIVIAWLLRLAWHQAPWLGYTPICLGISIGIMLAVASRIRVKDLAPNHACRAKPVECSGVAGGGMTIRFWNPQYARGFAEANHLELGVLPVTKYYSGGSLLKGATKPRVIGWVLCVMLAATSGLHAWMGGGANHRSSAEQAVTNGHGGDNFGSAYDAQRTERQARIDRLTEEHEVLVAKLKELDSQLEAEKSGLELVSTALERRGQAIENARSYLDNTDPNAVSSFNTEVDAYNGQRRAFTERVAQYNRKVRDGRADLDRLRQIESALGEMGVPYE